MNSISFLDAVLTRSLSSSRAASGSVTPQGAGPGSTSRHNDAEQSSGRLGRRASDYSLNRERERERRKIATSLGLTALDGGGQDGEPRQRRHHSKPNSRRASARSSGIDSDEDGERRDERRSRRLAAAGDLPALASETSTGSTRERPRRTGSTPAPLRQPSPPRRWGSLWGFGEYLEGRRAGQARSRPSLNPDDGLAGSSRHAQLSHSTSDLSSTPTHASLRRASTGDADAMAMHHLAHALLSEREREDVVDFEGADLDDDLSSSYPQAPPSTPFLAAAPVTPGREFGSRPSAPDFTSSVLGTGSRLSSILFGALNPLTDDYFGPQQSKRKSSISSTSSSTRKHRQDGAGRASGSTTPSDASRRSSRRVSISKIPPTDSARVSVELTAVDEKSAAAAGEDEGVQGHATENLPKDPPPPYSDINAGASTSKLSLSGSQASADGHTLLSGKAQRRRRGFVSTLARGAKTTIELLQRLVLVILLGPYRAYRAIKNATSSERNDKVAVPVPASTAQASKGRDGDVQRTRTASQGARVSAARHLRGRSERDAPVRDDESASDSDEVVTEDQAAARAERRARRAQAAEKGERAQSGEPPPSPSPGIASRLLPNPHPVDPLLAHDRNAEKHGTADGDEKQRQMQLERRTKQMQAGGRAAVVSRGPTSMLVHHSPKVLVLDLDETLIHSTSRSPTWSALADKSQSRTAVTAGGSLLGLEGLGGVLGLRGQVGVRPHQVEVVLDGRSLIYHVYKRPHVDTFLRKVAAWYHVVVFTASVQEYADPVIDWLDQGRGLISGRLFREACTYRNGSYLKNLAHVDADLGRICLVDNSPASYAINEANGIPIEGWTHDPNDEALLDLLPVLDSLRFASDVRHILGVRGFSA